MARRQWTKSSGREKILLIHMNRRTFRTPEHGIHFKFVGAHLIPQPTPFSGGALPVDIRIPGIPRASRGTVGSLEHSQAKKQVSNQTGVGLVQADRKDKACCVRALTTGSAGMRLRLASPMCGHDAHQPVDPVRWADSSLCSAMHHERFLEFHRENPPITFSDIHGNRRSARNC